MKHVDRKSLYKGQLDWRLEGKGGSAGGRAKRQQICVRRLGPRRKIDTIELDVMTYVPS
jgi:hypothetical protein